MILWQKNPDAAEEVLTFLLQSLKWYGLKYNFAFSWTVRQQRGFVVLNIVVAGPNLARLSEDFCCCHL
jgi:hypothetical protein